MKLARKFIVALILGVTLVLGAYAWLTVVGEVAAFEADMRRDQHLLGRVLAAAVSALWSIEGETRALALVRDANEAESELAIRWVWLDAPTGDAHAPRIDRKVLDPVAAGTELSYVVRGGGGRDGFLATYIPVAVVGPRARAGRVGALEVAESLRAEEHYLRWTEMRVGVTTVVMAGLCALLTIVLGVYFVGQPMRRLREKARLVGLGDLGGPLDLRQRDEVGELATEMNAMCERLAEANTRLASETAARLAALEQLRHAERLTTVGKLASGIAHELGTPLNVVAGRAKMIAVGDVAGDEARDNARIVVEQSERMTKIIRQLLDFARRRGPQKSAHDLVQIVQQTLTLLAPLAGKRRVTTRVESPADGAPVMGQVDVGQLQQVLTNLIVNGIHAMPGGGTLSLGVRRERARPPAGYAGPGAAAEAPAAGEWLRVSVGDEGVGIPPENVAHVFEPFFTTKGVGEGTGLGLSVAYGIVQEHGGWIAVDSEVGKGSCFSVYLPAEAPAVREAA
jgi:two-component system NtrC family sensor kinase